MRSRRRFILNGIIAAAAAVAGIAARGALAAASAKTAGKPKPHPTPSPTPKPPSTVARALARSLQHDLPAARISDAMTEKIAGDIESLFDISKAFRKQRLHNWDEPDFTYSALSGPQS